jgi:two-component system LytT family sensor kinase
VKIQPLLFISFLENAFKHGIKAQGESFINLKISVTDNILQVSIENSIAGKNMEESGGIGLENARKRLELLYSDNFDMKIHKSEKLFKVDISIPI